MAKINLSKLIPRLKQERFNIKKIAAGQMPYADFKLEENSLVDEAGAVLFELDGQKLYHPVYMMETAFALLNKYRQTGKKSYLEEAQVQADKLITLGIIEKGALIFPYPFEFAIHGSKEPTEILHSPWFSGMAQGEALSLFSKLYLCTKKRKYLKAADQVLLSFGLLQGESSPWVAVIDQGYYWIEEYPAIPYGHTLNGFLYALYGLYEYFLVKRDKVSRSLLEAGLTTVKEQISAFRNINGYSFYCLKHRYESDFYHQVHIKQLEKLYEITKEKVFKQYAELFKSDTKKAKGIFSKIKRVINKL